ncbi:hypothetical protein [Megasphaera elsdenii]|uniref:hypothetical protein n=1 Tax=Megasphaera elsdenii TaxID=907 RepID=UPI000933BF3E|nr:hypothetical protein [Megasphaera elsdenii]
MCAFCDDAGISHAEAKYIAAPYAGGAKVKCGAVWGALLIFLEKKYGKENAGKLQEQMCGRIIDLFSLAICLVNNVRQEIADLIT